MLSDRELIQHHLQGNAAAFRELYLRHVDRVHRLVSRLLGPDSPAADDVTQDVFMEVLRSVERFQGDSAFSTWLHRIALHVAVTALRRSIRVRRLPVPVAREPDPTGQLEAREELRSLYRALDALPPKNRVAFVLFELEGLTLEQISETTSVPLHTAAARLRRARLAVARAMDSEAELLHKHAHKRGES